VELVYDGKKKAIVNEGDLKYPENSAVKIVGKGANADYKELKVGFSSHPHRGYVLICFLELQEDVKKLGFEPFIAYPPGAEYGSIAKQDKGTLDDELFEKIKGANLKYGGTDVVVSRFSGQLPVSRNL
jgi:hypothetical protein